MFNLIMTNQEFGNGTLEMRRERVFEYTRTDISDQYRLSDDPDFVKLKTLPCLFMNEGTRDELAYVGHVTRVQTSRQSLLIDYIIDREIKPVANKWINEKRTAFSINDNFEFSRNHWAVKDVDLFRLLLTNSYPVRQFPKVFNIATNEAIQDNLLSVMMPFDASFGPVYAAIGEYAKSVGLKCQRADDIWQHDTIIQDVISLIDRSRIVICDCSGRNPNVFYETGVAHTLGRDVILITQSSSDIPFDLKHIRHIKYLNNKEGLTDLIKIIGERVSTLVQQ